MSKIKNTALALLAVKESYRMRTLLNDLSKNPENGKIYKDLVNSAKTFDTLAKEGFTESAYNQMTKEIQDVKNILE